MPDTTVETTDTFFKPHSQKKVFVKGFGFDLNISHNLHNHFKMI